jgi:type III restriction enzyme
LLLNRAANSGAMFEKLANLTSYTQSKGRKTSEVRRLMKLSRLLSNDGLEADAPDTAKALLVRVLTDEYERVKATAKFQGVMAARGKVNLEGLEWAVHGELSDTVSMVQIDLSPENMEELFEATGRKLTEGLHKEWQKVRVAAEPEAKRTAKRELLALCTEPRLFRDLDVKAQAQVQAWLSQYKMKINKFPESDRLRYDEIKQLASDPEPCNITYPQSVEGKKVETLWERHLFVDDAGKYPVKFTSSWEVKVIEVEMQAPDVVGWLRNIDRKPWSLCIPYDEGGVCKPFYPDFLFLRRTDDGLAVDLLDPHLISATDAPGKAVGLAKYAAKHHDDFGRIQLIIVEGEEIRRLELTDEKTREKVLGVSTATHLKQLFDAV